MLNNVYRFILVISICKIAVLTKAMRRFLLIFWLAGSSWTWTFFRLGGSSRACPQLIQKRWIWILPHSGGGVYQNARLGPMILVKFITYCPAVGQRLPKRALHAYAFGKRLPEKILITAFFYQKNTAVMHLLVLSLPAGYSPPGSRAR